jgi:peptide/nickel transport system permease protein
MIENIDGADVTPEIHTGLEGGSHGVAAISTGKRGGTGWWRIVAARVVRSIAMLLAVTVVIFILVDPSPGDAASTIAGSDASAAKVSEIRARLNLDEPLPIRYLKWLSHAVSGDLGRSLETPQSVARAVKAAAPATVSLVVCSTLLALVLSVAAGTLCAFRPNGIVDRIVVTLSSIGVAVPTFFIALVLVNNFAVERKWFPSIGYVPLSEGVAQWAKHMVLPALALSGVTTAELTRQLRGSLHESLREEYVLAAQARGIGRLRLVLRHGLKNAAVPLVTVFGLRLVTLLGGTVIVERVFAIRGLGSLMLDATSSSDVPIVLGIVVFFTILVIVVNLLVDVSYAYLNPRLRRS